MNIPHDKFCVLPWVSLEASPIGTVRPCCLADDELIDDAGSKFSLLTADFESIQNSQAMTQLREEFLAGKKPQTCRKCWNEERAGRTSKRTHGHHFRTGKRVSDGVKGIDDRRNKVPK